MLLCYWESITTQARSISSSSCMPQIILLCLLTLDQESLAILWQTECFPNVHNGKRVVQSLYLPHHRLVFPVISFALAHSDTETILVLEDTALICDAL